MINRDDYNGIRYIIKCENIIANYVYIGNGEDKLYFYDSVEDRDEDYQKVNQFVNNSMEDFKKEMVKSIKLDTAFDTYVKKPIKVKALWYTGTKIQKDYLLHLSNVFKFIDDNLYINTLEGKMLCSKGDFIIQGIQGEYYPCKREIFHKTYDIVKESKCLEN